MKKIIQWLAKIFKANITIEKIVEKEVIKEIYIKEPADTVINENVFIDGDLTVTGHVTGEVRCYSINQTKP